MLAQGGVWVVVAFGMLVRVLVGVEVTVEVFVAPGVRVLPPVGVLIGV
jgi:hypothetical protein